MNTRMKIVPNRLRAKIVDQINQAIICLMLAIIDQRTQCSKSHKAFNSDTRFTTDYAKSHVKAYKITEDKLKKLTKSYEILNETIEYGAELTFETVGEAYDVTSYLTNDLLYLDQLNFYR